MMPKRWSDIDPRLARRAARNELVLGVRDLVSETADRLAAVAVAQARERAARAERERAERRQRKGLDR